MIKRKMLGAAVIFGSLLLSVGCSTDKRDVTVGASAAEEVSVAEKSSVAEEVSASPETTSAEEVSAEENESAKREDEKTQEKDIYEDILNKYQMALAEEWREEKLYEEEMSPLVVYGRDSGANFGYCRMDINSDGFDELLIGAEGGDSLTDKILLDLYGMKDGEAVQILCSRERVSYYLYEDEENETYTIACRGSEGAGCYGWHYYVLNGTGLEVVQAVLYDSDYDEANPWFMSYDEDWDVSNDMPIDEELAEGVIDSYSKYFITPEYTFFEGNRTTLVNPVKEVTDEEMADLTGISFKVPEGAKGIRYTVIEADGMMPMAQMTFTYQGKDMFLRAQSVDVTEPVDISGLYYSWEENFEAEVGYCKAEGFLGDHAGYLRWIDVVPGIAYNLGMTENADRETLIELANDVFLPLQEERP